MNTVFIVMGIFGFVAFIEVMTLQSRVKNLERELAGIEGTSLSAEKKALADAVRDYAGKEVKIELREDEQDVDIVMYGNSRHGNNTILDADGEWMLVRTEGPKGAREKLIRLSSVQGIESK